jgi:hypothetical protein
VGLSLANMLGSVVAEFVAVALSVGIARALVSRPRSKRRGLFRRFGLSRSV